MQFAKKNLKNRLVCRRVIIINIITSDKSALNIPSRLQTRRRIDFIHRKKRVLVHPYSCIYIYIPIFSYKLVMRFVFYECLRVASLILWHEKSHYPSAALL